MRVIYRGFAGIPTATLDGKQAGDELDLTDEQIADLRRRGHEFEPADHRQNLPEAPPAPVTPAEATDEAKAKATAKK